MWRHLKCAAVLLGLLAWAWAYAEDAAAPNAATPTTTQETAAAPKAAAPAETIQETPAAPKAAPAETTQETPVAPKAAAPAETPQGATAALEAPKETPKGVAKDVTIVFDNSGSMRKNDPGHLATQAVADLVDGIQGDTRVALVIFDTKVNKAMPLTSLVDAKSKLREALKAINYRGQWTNSPDAVEQTVYDLKVNGREGAQKIIVFFTDGIVETGHPAQDAEKSRWLREELAQEAARLGIKIYAVAFTEEADYQLIQSLATKTGGEYYRSLKAEDLKDAFGRIAGEFAKLDQPKPVEAAPAAAAPAAPPAAAPPAAAEAPAPAAPAAEQPGLKEMEKATGIPKEQLEKMPEGQAIIVKPPEEAGISPGTQGILYAIVAAIGALVLVVIVLAVKMRKRGGQAAAQPEYAPQAFLRDLQGNTDAEQHALGLKAVMLGRVAGTDTSHLNYIVVNQTTIGRRHALIEYKDFSYWVVDQGSMNGTYVNGQRVTGEQRLKHGDHIRLHKYDFEFVMPEVADAGKTVFSAPPPERAAMTAATTAFTASPAAPSPAASVTPPAAAMAGEDETFDVTGGAFSPMASAAEQDSHEADTELRPRHADAAAQEEDIHEADTVIRPQQGAAAPAAEESLATFINTAVMDAAPGSATPVTGDEELSLDDFMDDSALTQAASPAPATADDESDRTLMPSEVPSSAPPGAPQSASKGTPKSGGAAADDESDRTLMPSEVPAVAPKPKPSGKEEHESDATTMFSSDDATLPPRRPSR